MNASEPRSDTQFDETPPQDADNGGNPQSPAVDDPLQKARAEAEEMKDSWLRARAEIENVRRQGQADVARAHKYAVEKFAEDLVAVKDALEQTVAADASVSIDTLKAGAEISIGRARSSIRTSTRRCRRWSAISRPAPSSRCSRKAT
jgi:molecular chaperone GrpE